MLYTHVVKKDLLQIQSPLYKAVLGLLEPHFKDDKSHRYQDRLNISLVLNKQQIREISLFIR